MVDGARSVLNDLLADVYIFTDHMTGPEAGQSPGYGLMLVAETTTGCFISAECTANAALKVSMLSAVCICPQTDEETVAGTQGTKASIHRQHLCRSDH